jgi:catechol 2,3-dioxygenase-like lactoylglutathione lyase family enzyme
MKILHVDHIGINVEDLAAAKEFFVGLGFKVMGEMTMQGELVERVIGLTNVKDDIVMLTSPDGQINIELVKFHYPKDPEGIQMYDANTLGLRHITFQVEDLDSVVKNLQQKGTKLVGEVQTYDDSWKLCYIRGPEGIIIELAELLKLTGF